MSEKIESMRKKVENHIDDNKAGPETKDSEMKEMLQEFMTALEELQVADEELRIQNEQLITGRQALEEQRQRYQELFEFTPDAYLVTDPLGVVLEANRAALALLKIEDRFLIRKPLISYVPESNRRDFRSTIAHINQTIDLEMTFKPRGAASFVAAVRMAPIGNPEGKLTGIRWIIRDISEQKQMAQDLRVSQERFQKVFTNATPGITLLNTDGQIMDCNPAFQDLLESTAEELQNAPLARFIFPDDQPTFHTRLRRLFREPVENTRVEIRFLRKDNGNFWGLVSFSRMFPHEGSEPYAILMVEDITAQKQLAAERVEMKHRLIDGIEAERTNLARELHDNALQTLYAAMYQLVAIDRKDIDDETQQQLDYTRLVISKVVNSIRMTCGELCSPSLNTFGLNKGIVAYIEKFAEIHPDIQVNLEIESEGMHLPERLSLALYRILQEGMANVIRHSKATHVDIVYKLEGDVITVRVADNGEGFHLPDNMVDFMRDGHYGLAGISERVEMIGGEMNIESTPGKGTVIEVSVPL